MFTLAAAASVPQLRLTPEGFRMRALLGSVAYRWSDVCYFAAVRNEVVSFDFSECYHRSPATKMAAFFNIMWAGAECNLPAAFEGLSAPELAELLNRWKIAHDLEAAARRDER